MMVILEIKPVTFTLSNIPSPFFFCFVLFFDKVSMNHQVIQTGLKLSTLLPPLVVPLCLFGHKTLQILGL